MTGVAPGASEDDAMRAITVVPGHADSLRLDDVPEPPADDGPVLVETLAIGVCGTDVEIVHGDYGVPPPGAERLILGHESLGRVADAPSGCGLTTGDLVVGIVRRPDPVPCPNCAVGEWDMCRNGRYTERGINGRNGYASDRYRIRPDYAVKVDPGLDRVGVLVEPASVVAKAWEHIARIGARAHWQPSQVMIIGAGPIGLLAALLGRQRGLDVVVFDQVTDGPKPGLVADLGATYRTGSVSETCAAADIVIECTGVSSLVLEVLGHTAPDGIVCLTGVSSGGRQLTIDAAQVNREMVLGNDVVFGSVNANRRHYETAAAALAQADRSWLERLITRRVPVEHWADALTRRPDDVKPIIEFAEGN
jgi:threonine dehydrogenase-like Zn-dependent dehydrogenase